MSGVEKSWGKTGERDREVKKESQLCKAILKSMEFTLGGMGEQGLKTMSRTEHRLDLTQVLKGLPAGCNEKLLQRSKGGNYTTM